MSGVIRPPWVDIQDFYNRFAKTPHFSAGDEGKARFQASPEANNKAVESLKEKTLGFQPREAYRMPFNYCDRWCEKCRLTEHCRVFKDEEESKKRWIRAGKDPNSMEYVLDTVGKSFKKVRGLIEKDAKRLGINLKEIDYSQKEEEPDPETFEIYQLAVRFSKVGKRILSDLQVVPEDVDEDLLVANVEMISYYNLIIPAKVYRAILSRAEEEKDPEIIEACPDARNSGFLVMNWLDEIMFSLTNLINHSPLRPMRGKLLSFKKVAINLKEVINTEFEVEEKEKVN